MYAEKLTRLGLETSAVEIVNPVDTMTRWLLQNHPDATVFPIAGEPPKDPLLRAGIEMSDDPAEIDVVIASYDRAFDYLRPLPRGGSIQVQDRPAACGPVLRLLL